MELNEEEKRQLFQVDGDCQAKVLDELYMTARFTRNPEQLDMVRGLIMKGTTRFLNHTDIPRKLSELLSKLRDERWLEGLPFDELVERSAYYFAELNYIHPFREGNGRAIREFMRLLFLRNGYEVNWAVVPAEVLLDAMEKSVFDTGKLQNVLAKSLSVITET